MAHYGSLPLHATVRDMFRFPLSIALAVLACVGATEAATSAAANSPRPDSVLWQFDTGG